MRSLTAGPVLQQVQCAHLWLSCSQRAHHHYQSVQTVLVPGLNQYAQAYTAQLSPPVSHSLQCCQYTDKSSARSAGV